MSRHTSLFQASHHAHLDPPLLDRIAALGIRDPAAATKALRLTLTVLGQRLTDDEALALSERLPAELARVIEQSEHSEFDGNFDAVEFYERVRRREKLPAGLVREYVNIVLEALGSTLDDEFRSRLARALPDAIGRQLMPAHFGEPPPHPKATHAPAMTTLAASRPGSRHPLSEARPAQGQTHSVVENSNPHGETKLSSSRGLTQERFDESLASGRPPGPAHPIAETDD